MRTDIHRPGSPDFDPEAYDLLGVFDLNPDWPNPEATRHRIQLVNGLRERGYRIGAHGMGQCGHCGTPIRYAALMAREDVKQYIWVGETCLDNRFELTKAEFDALRKQGQLDRERQRLLTAFTALCEQYPALAYATYADNIEIGIERDFADLNGQKVIGRDTQHLGTSPEDHRLASGTSFHTGVLADIARKARRYGSVSEKQIQFVEKLVSEIEGKVVAYRAKLAERATAPALPALTEGRQTIEGVVTKLVWKDNDFGYGGSFKATVKLDSGQRVWGTLPSSIEEDTEVGARIRFDAKVQPKEDDPSFGFYSRPTKATVVVPFAGSEAA